MFKCYIGNVPFQSTEEGLKNFFEQNIENGAVKSLIIIKDRETGRPRGFAFVEFQTKEQMDKAIGLNEMQFEGRPLRISQALEKDKRPNNGPSNFNGPNNFNNNRFSNDRTRSRYDNNR